MLKISEINSDPKATTLQLEGCIVGPWVEELRRACNAVLQDQCTLRLEMAEVDFVDAPGVALLAELCASGVDLSGTRPFVYEQLRSRPA